MPHKTRGIYFLAITMHFFLQNKICKTIKLRKKIRAFGGALYALKESDGFSSGVSAQGLFHSHSEHNSVISQ